ncbi:antitoxin [Agrobacterium sp. NPDC058088]|uniref:antitoxin n=1 Tax=Agrobacterium sp. NPDC058088 TaxID=3346335 RepID=UPI0036D9DE77
MPFFHSFLSNFPDKAGSQGTSEQYALERLFPGDTDAKRAWEELKTLMKIRFNEGLAGRLSTKTVDEILDEEISEGRA